MLDKLALTLTALFVAGVWWQHGWILGLLLAWVALVQAAVLITVNVLKSDVKMMDSYIEELDERLSRLRNEPAAVLPLVADRRPRAH